MTSGSENASGGTQKPEHLLQQETSDCSTLVNAAESHFGQRSFMGQFSPRAHAKARLADFLTRAGQSVLCYVLGRENAELSIDVTDANLGNEAHAQALLAVLDSYAADAMGGGAPLDPEVRRRLIPALREQANALVLLAFFEGAAVGLANCFYGFSTFAARPLLNVHDLAVLPAFRGRGVGRALLAAVDDRARARGCIKVTLEVLEDNAPARGLYRAHGFRDFELSGVSHRTLFLAKPLLPVAAP
jgi:ribosomal protein S18 acetylase RimI-like enzyme